MTKPPRKQEEKNKIKNTIIEKAIEILVSDGFEQLTMRSIAKKCRMSATNIYNYFSNKDEIYITILINGFVLLHNDLTRASMRGVDPIENAKAFLSAYFKFGLDNRHYYDIMFSRPTPKFNDYVGTPMEELAKIEMDVSTKIITLSVRIVQDVYKKFNRPFTEERINQRLIQGWSMIHGLISLYNSNVIDYVVAAPQATCDAAIDDYVTSLTRSMVQSMTS